MTEPKRRRFDRAFKLETVKLITEQGKPISQAAREIGIHENTLYKWVRLYKEDPEQCFPGKGHMKPEEEELHRLKRRIAVLEEENAILKKATAIFANGPK